MHDPKDELDYATYDLDEIKRLILEGKRLVTGKAYRSALAINYTEEDIYDCVLGLSDRVFYKINAV